MLNVSIDAQLWSMSIYDAGGELSRGAAAW